MELSIPKIDESVTKVKTIEFPNHSLLSVNGNQPKAAVAVARLVSEGKPSDTFFALADAKVEDKPQPQTYVIVNTGELAASVINNVMIDGERFYSQVTEKAGVKSIHVWNPAWTWRAGPVEAPKTLNLWQQRLAPLWEKWNETVEVPFCKVVVTGDCNKDSQVDWQDGALAYRDHARAPYGSDQMKDAVVSQISMNFASQAQHPFLAMLDEVKMVYLYTDGLGQDLQFKGYQTEGHDSSHPDYDNVGRRQGGAAELNYTLKRMKDFNARGGIHINATEYYPEARTFNKELVDPASRGWAWLDQSYYTNQSYDIISGQLYSRLDAMRQALPELSWVYLDVYFGKGWDAWKMARKMEQLNLPFQTEFTPVLEREVVWHHRANEYANLGTDSQIARFIWNDAKDSWCVDPLLRGSQNLGYLGWHSERDVPAFIRCIFTENLPTKYLQHHRLLKLTADKAIFSDGITAEKIDAQTYGIFENGNLRVRSKWTKGYKKQRWGEDNLVFIPWEERIGHCYLSSMPLELRPQKFYHYSDKGGKSTWTLPALSSKATSLHYYELTDQGRIFVCNVPVVDGKVTLEAKPRIPYVLYQGEPEAKDMVWGEGSFLRDPGFHNKSFFGNCSTSHIRVATAENGQTCLEIAGNNGARGEVSQPVYGLKPGAWYATNVWTEITGNRQATLAIRPWPGYAAPEPMSKQDWKIVSVSSEETGAEQTPAANAIDGDPSTIWHTQYSAKQPAHPHELVVDMGKDLLATGFTYLPRAGNANGTVKAYSFQMSKDGKEWKTTAEGEFAGKQGPAGYAIIFKSPMRAQFFKFIAKSEIAGQNFASAAEIGVISPAASAAPALSPIACTIRKTDVPNYQDNHDKYLTCWQRLRVVFQAPADGSPVEFCLRGEAGDADAIVRFDDARIQEIAKPDMKGHLYAEDFENVESYWGPFVYGFQGNTRIHLSEAHLPFTDDTIDGNYSLKIMEGDQKLLVRSTTALLPLKANTTYKLEFDYLQNNPGQYAFVFGSNDAKAEQKIPVPAGGWKRAKFSTLFTTGAGDDWYIGVRKIAADPKERPKVEAQDIGSSKDSQVGMFVIDNLVVDELK
jgi:hypothetical protein